MVFGQQQQGSGGFGSRGAPPAWGNKGQQQQGGGGQGQGQGGMMFGKRAQPQGAGAGPAGGGGRGQGPGRGAAGRGSQQWGPAGRQGGGRAGAAPWQDTGAGRGRGRSTGGLGQHQYSQQPYNQQQNRQQRTPQPQQGRPAPAAAQQAPQQEKRMSPGLLARLGSASASFFGLSSGSKNQQQQQQQDQQQAPPGGGRGGGRFDSRGAVRGRGHGGNQQWASNRQGWQQQQGGWEAEQQQQPQGRSQAARGGRGGGRGSGDSRRQQGQQYQDTSGGGRGRGRGRDRGRGRNQSWTRKQDAGWSSQEYPGGEEAEMGDAEGYDEASDAAAAAAAAAGGVGAADEWQQGGDDGGEYEGGDGGMDMQDYDMDEAYEQGWDEVDYQEGGEAGDDGAAEDMVQPAPATTPFKQQQLEQQPQPVTQQPLAGFGAAAPPVAARSTPRAAARVPIPSPAPVPAQQRTPAASAAVRAAVAAIAADAAGIPEPEYRYAIPEPHAPGSLDTSYDGLDQGSVVQIAEQRASPRRLTAGAKQPQCNDMCPAQERAARTAENQLHPYEQLPDRYATTAELAVKKFQRSHAGEETANSDLRTWPALRKTVAHLRKLLCRLGTPDWVSDQAAVYELLEAHRFLWDRYRAIRKDISQTQIWYQTPAQLHWAICANEEIARFMLVADALLASKDKVNAAAKAAMESTEEQGKPRSPAPKLTYDLDAFREAQLAQEREMEADGGSFEPDPYDSHLNHQELSKTLLDLRQMYAEAARIGLPAPNEGEFMAYYIIVSRGTYGSYKSEPHNVVQSLTGMSKQALVTPHVQYALAVSSAVMTTNWVQLMRLLEGGPLLLAAAAQVYVSGMRSKALVHMLRNATQIMVSVGPGLNKQKAKRVPLQYYQDMLRFDDAAQAKEFIRLHQASCPGLSITTDSAGEGVIQLLSSSSVLLAALRTTPRHTLPWLASKAEGSSLPEVITQPCPAPDMGTLGVLPAPARPPALPPPAAAAAAVPARAPAASAGAATGFGTAAGPSTASSQQQPQGGCFQFGAAAAAPGAAPAPAAAAGAFGAAAGWGTQQQQQQPGAFALGSAPGGRGSSDRLVTMMPPAAAAAGATAVFGSLAPSAAPGAAAGFGQAGMLVGGQQQPAVQAAGFGAGAAWPSAAAQQQPQQQPPAWQQQQQLQQATWAQQQQQQQQQQQWAQQQQQQQQQPAESAGVATAAAAKAQAVADEALRAENAVLKQRLAVMEAEQQEEQQVGQLSQQLAAVRRRRIMRRWRAAVAAAKEAHALLAVQLAAANPAVGRMGEGLLRTRRRQKLLQELDDVDALARQGKRQRSMQPQEDPAAALEEALQDTSPLNVANIVAAALAGADSSSIGGSSSIYLPNMASSGLSVGAMADSSRGSFSGSSRGTPSRAAPLTVRLVCVSGWGETEPSCAPPVAQRRIAKWLRHKLADPRPPTIPGLLSSSHAAAGAAAAGNGAWGAAPGSAWAAVQQQPQLVPLDGPSNVQQQQQQQQPRHRSWASVVKGSQLSNGSDHQGQPQMVLQLESGVELLVSRTSAVPGPAEADIRVELLDVAPTALEAAVSSSSSTGRSNVAGVLQGASGVLLLVSGPNKLELAGAVRRLGVLLQHWPAAVTVPVTVLACSGPSTQQAIEAHMSHHVSRLPPELRARVGSAQLVCLGPGEQHPEAVVVAALQHAAAAAAALLPQLHSVQVSSLLQALTVLELRAKLAAAEALAAVAAAVTAAAAGSNGSYSNSLLGGSVAGATDVLSAFVEAHNTGLTSLGNCLQAQLDSTAAAWGYPPSSYSCASGSQAGSVWQLMQQVLQAADSLRLPEPPPLSKFLQQQGQQRESAAAVLAQFTSFLDDLSSGFIEDSSSSSEEVSEVVVAVATGVRALLTAKLVQQEQQQLLSGSHRGLQRQLQLVRSHCELLVERLQQQPLLQVVLPVDAGDLRLIAAADEEQQQPGWWQAQQQLVVQAAAQQRHEQLQQHASNGVGEWQLASLAAGADFVNGAGASAQPGGYATPQKQQQQQPPEEASWLASPPAAVTSTAKQQAAVAAQLLDKCRLQPWAM